VIVGEKGAGKGTLGNTMRKLFGQHGLHITSSKRLTGNFNTHLRDCCFLFADEAYWPGDRNAQGEFQRLITEDDLTVEGKGKDLITCRNMLHIIMAAEEGWIVPAGKNERRYAVLKSLSLHMQDKIYFDALYNQMENGGYEAMLFDLLNMDIKGFHPRYNPPQTEALLEQQEISLNPFEIWWAELLENGVLPASSAPGKSPSNDFEIIHHPSGRIDRKKGLYTLARESSPRLKNESDHALGNFLRAHGCVNSNHVPTKGAVRRGWKFPPLGEARTAWVSKIKGWKWHNVGDLFEEWRADA